MPKVTLSRRDLRHFVYLCALCMLMAGDNVDPPDTTKRILPMFANPSAAREAASFLVAAALSAMLLISAATSLPLASKQLLPADRQESPAELQSLPLVHVSLAP